MSEPQNNGVPRNPLKPTVLWEGAVLYRCDEDDPDVIEESWPNGDGPRSDSALPPKKDEVRETPTKELLALMNAMNAYKRKRGLEYLLWDDVLDVLHDMGYRKVAPPADAPAQPEAAKSSTP